MPSLIFLHANSRNWLLARVFVQRAWQKAGLCLQSTSEHSTNGSWWMQSFPVMWSVNCIVCREWVVRLQKEETRFFILFSYYVFSLLCRSLILLHQENAGKSWSSILHSAEKQFKEEALCFCFEAGPQISDEYSPHPLLSPALCSQLC